MIAKATENSNHVFKAPDGAKDIHDLPCQLLKDETGQLEIVRSVWIISENERQMIANGANIELDVYWIGAFPPVAVNVTDEKEVAQDAAA